MARFSTFAQTLQADDIAEILALTQKPEVISFAGGLPAPELFPIEEMKKVDEAIYTEQGRQAVQYGPTQGYDLLREQLAARMKDKFFVDCTPDNIVITTGSQQFSWKARLTWVPSWLSIRPVRDIPPFRQMKTALLLKSWKKSWLQTIPFA